MTMMDTALNVSKVLEDLDATMMSTWNFTMYVAEGGYVPIDPNWVWIEASEWVADQGQGVLTVGSNLPAGSETLRAFFSQDVANLMSWWAGLPVAADPASMTFSMTNPNWAVNPEMVQSLMV